VDLDGLAEASCEHQVAAIDEILRADPVLDLLLDVLETLPLPDWYVGAGAVAAAVWNHRFGLPPGTAVRDYDVVYYDPADLSAERERAVELAVQAVVGENVAIDVTNEARVHLWYGERFGRSIPQYASSQAAIATWPSTATSVGVRRSGGRLEVYAPHGLRDLLLGVVRPNRTLVTREVYEAKATRWRNAWPSLTVIPW